MMMSNRISQIFIKYQLTGCHLRRSTNQMTERFCFIIQAMGQPLLKYWEKGGGGGGGQNYFP
jgi:hypothetical protein